MALFDVYIAVDWSARSTPSSATPTRDAVWAGELVVEPGSESASATSEYFPTRRACEVTLRGRLIEHVARGRRVFVGFDFPFGYPAGFAIALGLDLTVAPWRAAWRELADQISDDERNQNNRFDVAAEFNRRIGGGEGPFWGCPSSAACETLGSTMRNRFSYPYPIAAGGSIAEKRATERALKGVQPTWKLHGNGSVGSQALVGIPTVERLRFDPALKDASLVWPFETGFSADLLSGAGPRVVFAEIWPGTNPNPLNPSIPIRDQQQVIAYVERLAELDAGPALGSLFGRPNVEFDETACLGEEGWIFGAGTRSAVTESKIESPGGESRSSDPDRAPSIADRFRRVARGLRDRHS